MPAHVRQAVLAAEDRTFYSNHGFDPVGIARAVYNQLTGGVGGGSTITQQYVKVSTGQDQASLWRKYKEIIVSIKISKELTKDQILENYLNTVYFGRGAYGIQAAAQAYFHKDVEPALDHPGRDARRDDPVAVGARPDEEPRGQHDPLELHARPDAGRGLPPARRAGAAEVPRRRAARRAGRGGRARRRPLPHLRAGRGGAAGQRDLAGPDRHRRPRRHHHDRREPAEGRGRRRQQGDEGPARQPAHGARRGRPAHRRDPGLLRRLERARHRLRGRRGHPAAGVHVQAVRRGRGAAERGRLRAGHAVRRARRRW